jgi:hypothetical protein
LNVTLWRFEEAPDRGATTRDPVLAHRMNDLIQRQVRLLRNQRQQKIRVRLQRRSTPAAPLGRAASGRPKASNPLDRNARADLKLFRRLPS